MGKFPRNVGPERRQPEEFEMTSEMLEKLTNNMKWKLWPTTEDSDTSSPANTSSSSNKENDVVVGCPNKEVGAEVIAVNEVSSLLSNLKLKAGICAMTDVVDATPGTNSLLLEPSLKDQDHLHQIQKMKENKPIKYSREFLLMIRNEMKKQNKPFTGTIECPVVIRGNNDERFNTVTIPRRGQNLRQQQQPKYNPNNGFGENVPNFNNGVPAALHDHYYSSMNGNGIGNRNGFYSNYHQTDNNYNNRYFGRRRRNSSESSTGSMSNNNNNNSTNNKTNKIPSLLSTPILKPLISSSTTTTATGITGSSTNRVLRDSTQNKQATNPRGRYVMEPLILKKPNTDVADILKKNQVKSILPLKVIKN